MESYLINKSLINVNRFRGGRKNTPKYTTLYNIKYLSNQDMIAFLYIIATKRECEKSSSVITTAEIVIMMHFVGFLFLTSLTILPECNEAVKDDDLRCARYIFLSFFLSLLKKNILIWKQAITRREVKCKIYVEKALTEIFFEWLTVGH